MKCERSLFTRAPAWSARCKPSSKGARAKATRAKAVWSSSNGANEGTYGIKEPVELEVARVGGAGEDIGVCTPARYVRGDVRARKVASDDFADVGVQEQWDVGVIELEHGVTPY